VVSEEAAQSRSDKYTKALAEIEVDEPSAQRLGGRREERVAEAYGGGRSLNVFFNWNGHTWDAHEVLGLPAGASRDKVVQAFHAARARAGRGSLPFLQAAADAILKRSA
jgi:hypothetical protein